jgi:hypothetical protein
MPLLAANRSGERRQCFPSASSQRKCPFGKRNRPGPKWLNPRRARHVCGEMSTLNAVRDRRRRAASSTPSISFQESKARPHSREGSPCLPVLTHRLSATFNVQAKLKVSQPGDAYEREADRAAELVTGASDTSYSSSDSGETPLQDIRVAEHEKGERSDSPLVSLPLWAGGAIVLQRNCSGCEGGSPCPECEEGKGAVQRKADTAMGATGGEVSSTLLKNNGPGSPLDSRTREFMESRFGYNFSQVRVHTDSEAAESASALDALAYTVGRDIVFGERQYAPRTASGAKLIAHELSHVVQQSDPSTGLGIFRVSPSMCSSSATCGTADTAGTGTASSWKLTLAVDREQKGLGRIFSGDVGHTWVKLTDDSGTKYSYGFWPQSGFDPKSPRKSVAGCVHHPDTTHEPPSATEYKGIEYTISKASFTKAIAAAEAVCKASPDYNLFSNNCTSFAIDVVKAADVAPPPSTTLAIDNPNALFEGIEETPKPVSTTSALKSDSDIRDWVNRVSPASIEDVSQSEKTRLVNVLLNGWVSNDDVDAIERIYKNTPSAQRPTVGHAIEARIGDLSSSSQRARLRLLLE